jgi:hypothetical protein
MKFHFIIITLLFVLLSSCEKDITVSLPEGEEKIVVEGYVEAGRPPYVLLSKSTGYFAPFDSASVTQYAVKNALVVICDGILCDTLISPFTSVGYLYLSQNLIGTVGRNYTLYIKTEEGIELSSSTYCYPPVALDSTWFKVQDGKDSLGWVWARLTEPDTLGNFYRWFAKRIGKDNDFIAPIGSVFSDRFINGRSFDFAYNRGKYPNSTAEDDNNEEAGYFKKGDTIIIKFCSIGPASYDFWRAAEDQLASNGNPFSTVNYIPSNIKGGIGIFEAYTPSFDTVIAPKN